MPGKPLADIAGLPLIEHVRRRVCATGLFDTVIVATDDLRIQSAVEDYGGRVILTGDHANGTHRVHGALQLCSASPDRVVNVQGDQPLIDETALAPLVAHSGPCDVVTAATAYLGDPADRARVKVWVDGAGLAVDFGRDPRTNRSHLHHVGLYGFTPDALSRAVRAPLSARCQSEALEQLAWMDHGMRIAVVSVPNEPASVDTPQQLDALRLRFASGELQVPLPVD